MPGADRVACQELLHIHFPEVQGVALDSIGVIGEQVKSIPIFEPGNPGFKNGNFSFAQDSRKAQAVYRIL